MFTQIKMRQSKDLQFISPDKFTKPFAAHKKASLLKYKKLDRGSKRSSPRYGLITPYRLFHLVPCSIWSFLQWICLPWMLTCPSPCCPPEFFLWLFMLVPSCLKVMGVGWGGGPWDFIVSPSSLGFGFLGFGAKGLGPGLDNCTWINIMQGKPSKRKFKKNYNWVIETRPLLGHRNVKQLNKIKTHFKHNFEKSKILLAIHPPAWYFKASLTKQTCS